MVPPLFVDCSWGLVLLLSAGCSSNVGTPGGTDGQSSSSGSAISTSSTATVDPPASTSSAPGTSSEGGVASTDSSSGSSSTGLVFPDPCDSFAQDCPEGYKCNPFANDEGSAWNDVMCVPVDADPDGYGERCTAVDSGVSGFDSCDVGAMCLVDNLDTLEGECVELCGGSPSEPTCVQENAFCRITGDGVFNACLISCDPLADDCDRGETCVSSNGGQFSCVTEGDGLYAEACEFLNDCVDGLGCFMSAESVCESSDTGCCLPYCDLQAPDCPDGLACTAFFNEGAPRGYEDLGVCFDPA